MIHLMSPAPASTQPHRNQHLSSSISFLSLSQLRIQQHFFTKVLPPLALGFVLNLQGTEGSLSINDFLIIGKTCSQAQRCYMDTWIRILTHMDSSRRHWPSGDSETMRISLPFDQCTLECREVLCKAPFNGGNYICNKFSPLRHSFGELISDITYTSNLGNLAIEVMNDFFLHQGMQQLK